MTFHSRGLALILRSSLLAGWCLLFAGGCGSGLAHPSVSVAPIAGEDLAKACRYDLIQGEPTVPQAGVLVIFDRADTVDLYEADDVRTTAATLNLSLVWAHECDAKSSGDLQADASKGPARALEEALREFAGQSGHPELTTVPMVLYGFSAAGVLALTMEQAMPQRLGGVIAYAAGSAFTNLDGVGVSPAAAQVPTLLLGNAQDNLSGVSRSLRYFGRGRAQNAPWGMAIQNDTGHCCNPSTRPLILPWITAVVTAGLGKPAAVGDAGSTLASFDCVSDGQLDSQGETDCAFANPVLGVGTKLAPQTGWLPDAATGAAWLKWVTNPGTN